MLDVGSSHTPDNGRNQSSHHVTALTSDHGRNQSSHHVRMAQHLHLTMEGTNPLTMSEGLSTDTSLPLGRNLDLENTKLLPEVLKIHPSQWLSQHINYLFIRHNILEFHYSSLYHIPDIVIFDLHLDATCIYRDNQSCVKLSENPIFHDKSKHIKIKYHYIKDML